MSTKKRLNKHPYGAWLICMTLGLAHASLGQTASQPIKISVDATEAAHKMLHSQLEIPVSAGPLTLYYPKWMPADHSPDGPIANLTGLHFSSNGKKVPWRRDLEDMYSIHLDIPQGSTSLTANLDFLLSAPGPTMDFAASASSKILVLMWNQVLLYPSGKPAHEISYSPELRLPEGWKFNSSLPVSKQSNGAIAFAPIPLDLLIDSPVQSGEFIKAIPLTSNGSPLHELDVASDEAWALDIPPQLIANYKKLVEQAALLYKSYHYRDYHFLLTLSDNVLPLGQEHHESSDDRVAEHSLVDPNARILVSGLLPHEFTHSWNGQYRRPTGLATSDFQKPMQGELLWVYEGLTEYLQTVLTARSGLLTQAQSQEDLAAVASTLEHRAGRSWRSLQDTADSAQVLYFAPAQWASSRRSVDFYPESTFLWLDVDMTIRQQTHGSRSMDDFCRLFLGGPNGEPIIKPYDFDEVVETLNKVAPYDWRTFLRDRLDYTGPNAPLNGVTKSGWKLVYTDEPNEILAAEQAVSGNGNFTSSLGLIVKSNGVIQDVIPAMPAAKGGLSPYAKILSVNGRLFSMEEMNRAVSNSKANASGIEIIVSNTGTIERHVIQYQGGLRGPHLQRIAAEHDYLSDLFAPLPRP